MHNSINSAAFFIYDFYFQRIAAAVLLTASNSQHICRIPNVFRYMFSNRFPLWYRMMNMF